jgi:ribosomal protein L31E
MTKEEAIKAMKDGKKVTHRHFTAEEWVTMNNIGQMVFEDGCRCPPHEFWEWRKDESFLTDWELFKA